MRLERLLNVKPRLGRGWAEVEGVNACVGVRIVPTRADEQRTRVYPNIKEMRFSRIRASAENPKPKVRALYWVALRLVGRDFLGNIP